MSADIEMLVTRLRWPIGATRWWAMQELAALLLSSHTQEEAQRQLLAELARCRLEAETVEIVCVFWIAAQHGYRPPSELVPTLTTPSMLAAMLLGDMKLNLRRAPNPLPEVCPQDFEVPAIFEGAQGVDMPRVYRTRLTQLERETGLPFVRQAAFEWSRTEEAYPQAPLQGDFGHFISPIGTGTTGAFATRAMLRMLTAYQRTLEVARVIWRVPEKLILSWVVDALPVDPTLALLRPRRPPWLPNFGMGVTTNAASVERFITGMSDSLAAAQRGAVLLAMVSPTYISSNEIVELSVVRWRKWGAAEIDASTLGSNFYRRQSHHDYGSCRAPVWGLKTYVPASRLEDVLDSEANAAPMAAVYGFSRIGYLQRDLYPSRLYYPIITGRDDRLTVEPSNGELRISAAHGPTATFGYWNAGWSAVHPAEMSGLCGTALVQTGDDTRAAKTEPPADSHFYLWKVMRLKRSYSYERFMEDEPLYGIVQQ